MPGQCVMGAMHMPLADTGQPAHSTPASNARTVGVHSVACLWILYKLGALPQQKQSGGSFCNFGPITNDGVVLQ
jgi:hypothetical protein